MYEIYLVTNTVNGKVYVGQTSQGFQQRWNQHKNAAKSGNDCYLYRGIRKHGIANFVSEILEVLETREQANEAEIRWIAHLDSCNSDKGYNGMRGGDGSEPTDATREKLSKTRKKQFEDPEFKARMIAANVGKSHTEEGKANISKALEGNQYRTGIPHSEETKLQVSESVKRSYAEGRHKRGTGLKKGTVLGPMSEEEKKKRSEGVKRARQNRFWSTRKKTLAA